MSKTSAIETIESLRGVVERLKDKTFQGIIVVCEVNNKEGNFVQKGMLRDLLPLYLITSMRLRQEYDKAIQELADSIKNGG